MTDTGHTPTPVIQSKIGPIVLPDVRGWAMVFAFVIVLYILHGIFTSGHDASGKLILLSDASFMQFATLIVSGTLIMLFANLFGGTKSAVDTNKIIATAQASPPPAPTIVMAPAPAAATSLSPTAGE